MASSIPVDIYNPGQVIACVGLLEISELLAAPAHGYFSELEPDSDRWRFNLDTPGEPNPVRAALGFLAGVKIDDWAPHEDFVHDKQEFPGNPKKDKKGNYDHLPVLLRNGETTISVSHWADDSSRNKCKLFAGRQSGAEIVRLLLSLPKRGSERKGLKQLFGSDAEQLCADPFGEKAAGKQALVPCLGKNFGFDARGAWDTIDTGSSLDETKTPSIISPVVELLSVIGLENSRPQFIRGAHFVNYYVWLRNLPTAMCRAALGNAEDFLPDASRIALTTYTGSDQYYKRFNFATRRN